MSDLDTLRWGDTQELLFTPNSDATVAAPSKQMVAAHWRRPLGWVVNVVINPQLNSDETADVILDVTLTQGSGGAIISGHKRYTMTLAGGYAPVLDSFQIAAQDIQVAVSASIKNGASAAQEGLQVGVFVAPVTEPAAAARQTDALERMPADPRYMHTIPAAPFPGDGPGPSAPGGLHFQRR